MSEQNKNERADRAFQRKFRDFEAAPSRKVWENIETELDKQSSSKTGIVFWWVAAAFAILSAAGIYYFSGSENEVTLLADDERIKEDKSLEFSDNEVPENNVRPTKIIEKSNNTEVIPFSRNAAVEKENTISENIINPGAKHIVKAEKTVSQNNNTPANNIKSNGLTPGPKSHDKLREHGIPSPTKTTSEIIENDDIIQNENVQKHSEETEIVIEDTEVPTEEINTNPTVSTKAENLADSSETVAVASAAIPESEDQTANNNQPSKEGDYASDSFRWSLGVLSGPLYAGRSLTAKNDKAQRYIDHSHENAIISYTTGLEVGYDVNGKFKLITGLQYYKLRQNSNQELIQINNKNQKEGGYFIVSSSGTFENEYQLTENNNSYVYSWDQNFQLSADSGTGSFAVPNISTSSIDTTMLLLKESYSFLSIPFAAKYYFFNKRIRLSCVAGVTASFPVSNRTTVYKKEAAEADYTKIGEDRNTSLNPVYYSSMFRFGAEYLLTGKTSLHLEPQFRYALSSMNKDHFIETRPYTFGVLAGISWQL